MKPLLDKWISKGCFGNDHTVYSRSKAMRSGATQPAFAATHPLQHGILCNKAFSTTRNAGVKREYLELTRSIERMHRRFLDVLRAEL
ncbi:MAG: hypothetical protein ACXW39_10350, partial [Nitrospira sp.]